MIAEARVHSIKNLLPEERKEHGALVLIMRQYPRGLSNKDIDYWVQDAAPKQYLLDEYREGLVSWAEFETRYQTQQDLATSCRVVRYSGGEKISDARHQKSPVSVLQELEAHFGKVTLLCWENSECCHRHVLKADMERMTEQVEVLA